MFKWLKQFKIESISILGIKIVIKPPSDPKILPVNSISCAAIVCGENGQYGYACDCSTIEEAIQTATELCKEVGAKNISVLCTSDQPGYGAVAKHYQFIGASCGCSNEEDAKEKARENCKKRGGTNVRIVRVFYSPTSEEP